MKACGLSKVFVRRGSRGRGQVLLRALVGVLVTLFAGLAAAAPEARILRIDPRAALQNNSPVLTSVVEISQTKRLSEAISGCAALSGNSQLDCMSQALERPLALYTPFPFPAANALFTVSVDGRDVPAKYVSHASWGESQQQPGVGTAWLILIDADRRMGGGFADAKRIAQQFIQSMGPNDIVNVMFFNDRQVVKDSRWLPAAQGKNAQAFVQSVGDTYTSTGRNRSLLTILKNAATDGFKALGNVSEDVKVPLHQALVLLSSGFGGADPSTTGPGALQLQQYLSQGRFPEDNTALPKAPVPAISLYFPHSTYQEFKMNSLEFMQNIANPELGGFFSVVQEGGGARAAGIVNAVRQRFAKMHIVKWRVSCLEPSITQSFKLNFTDVKPQIVGDNSFKDVPIGMDPTSWPLDVNREYTAEMTKTNAVHPGGSFKVFGEFCWGGDASRAEVYFLPAGQQPPTALAGNDVERAKRTQQQLIAMGMKGTTLEAGNGFARFTAPDKDTILHGSGDQAVVRIVLYDNRAQRTTGVTADTIIQLKGSTAPLPLLWILGGSFAVVVLALLLVVILRSGGKKRPGGGPPPGLAPVVAGPSPGGYGAPPPAYGGQPGGYGAPQPGGYGAPPPYQPQAQPQHQPAPGPQPGYGGAAPAPMPQQGPVSSAILHGSAGTFTILSGQELRAGRDPSQCGIVLNEPRVSSVHATLKLDMGQLLIKDENSNNGTLVNNGRLTPGVWSPVPPGSLLRLGPVELSVRLQ